MTSVDSTALPAPDPGLLVIESFLDGEPVNPQSLAEALAQPEGREYLVELLALREAVSATGPHGWATLERKRPRGARGVPWLAAAAGVVLSLTTGYLAGQEAAQPPPAESGVEAVMDSAAPALPEPTRVIPLRPGVNWTETSRGR
jgi:hypothetical protein